MNSRKKMYLTRKHERRIMKHILNEADFTGTYIINLEKDFSPAEFELYDVKAIRELGIPDVVHALEMLQHQGYIRLSYLEEEPIIIVTAEGKFYFEQINRDRYDFIKKSILTPIAISITVSLVVTAIVNLLWP